MQPLCPSLQASGAPATTCNKGDFPFELSHRFLLLLWPRLRLIKLLGEAEGEPLNIDFPYHLNSLFLGNSLPNMGSPLFDCSFVASSWITSQCSSKMPSFIRITSTTTQFGPSGRV